MLLALLQEAADAEDRLLAKEARILRALAAAGASRIPQVLFDGVVRSEYYMVMERHGPSLEEFMRSQPDGRLALEVVKQIGQMLYSCIEKIHDAGFIHRDIGPRNVVKAMGEDKLDKLDICLVDFGLAKRYGNLTRQPFRNPVGDVDFMGVNAHAFGAAHLGGVLEEC